MTSDSESGTTGIDATERKPKRSRNCSGRGRGSLPSGLGKGGGKGRGPTETEKLNEAAEWKAHTHAHYIARTHTHPVIYTGRKGRKQQSRRCVIWWKACRRV